MALFDSVSRDLHNEVVQQRDEWRRRYDELNARYEALLETTVAIKRQEHGLAPANYDAAANDPLALLGPKTQMAVEEFAAGDRELRNILIRTATLLTAELMGDEAGKKPDDTVDAEVAKQIMKGDQ